MPLIQSVDRRVLACVFLLLGSLTVSGVVPAFAGEKTTVGAKINWHKYMQSAANVSAVAMGLSFVGQCSKKLHFEENSDVDEDGGSLALAMSCYGNEDEEGSAILHFNLQPDGVILFEKIEYAG